MSLNNIIEKWLEDTTQTLDISYLNLTEWPKQLIGKEHLIKKLDCYHNQLTSLPNNLTGLERLDCSSNKLKSLPNNLTKLKTLSFWNNKLTSLPNDLTKLKELYCTNNELTSLPNSLTNLKILSCPFNKLTSLPNNLTKLKELYCSDNELTFLPNDLTKLKLETIFCSNNKLFSDELKKWKKIWLISIRHQRILRNSGLKRVVKVLKNRLYLPRLNELREELIWSPNHHGKFFKSLPRYGNW
uniref:Leucine rich repeat protein n=1 Tax=Pithovirus LCPAC001 TaxID=2506585 RepID=A0A481Z216_9VIRU|nr:MAG: leucine rich repeat protein [Pithovirus LCPAC001]